jgi:hypothetical protein
MSVFFLSAGKVKISVSTVSPKTKEPAPINEIFKVMIK